MDVGFVSYNHQRIYFPVLTGVPGLNYNFCWFFWGSITAAQLHKLHAKYVINKAGRLCWGLTKFSVGVVHFQASNIIKEGGVRLMEVFFFLPFQVLEFTLLYTLFRYFCPQPAVISICKVIVALQESPCCAAIATAAACGMQSFCTDVVVALRWRHQWEAEEDAIQWSCFLLALVISETTCGEASTHPAWTPPLLGYVG